MTHKERLERAAKLEREYLRKGKEEYNQAFSEIEKELIYFGDKYGVNGKLNRNQSTKYDRDKTLEKSIIAILGAVTIMNSQTIGAYAATQYEFNFTAQKEIIEQVAKRPVSYYFKKRKDIIDELITGLDRVSLLDNNQQLKNKVARAIQQGITQGKTVRQTSKLVQLQMNSNAKDATRIVTTETGKAIGAGQFDSMQGAISRGIDLKKQWKQNWSLHPRETHARLDGEIRDVNEPFSNGLMYPVDPTGDPSETINCHCTMVEIIS